MVEILRHKKTGGLYEVQCRGATVETSTLLADYAEAIVCRRVSDGGIVVRPANVPVPTNRIALYGASVQASTPLANGDEVTVYRNQDDDLLTWVRPTAEMGDGRFEPAHPGSATPSGDGGESATRAEIGGLVDRLERAVRMHEANCWSGPIGDKAQLVEDINAARTALLSRITSPSSGVSQGEPPRDAGRALKEALFACLREGGEDRQYGGVLTEGGSYAWVRFTRELPTDASQPTGEPKIGARRLHLAIDAFLANDPASLEVRMLAALKAADANPQE